MLLKPVSGRRCPGCSELSERSRSVLESLISARLEKIPKIKEFNGLRMDLGHSGWELPAAKSDEAELWSCGGLGRSKGDEGDRTIDDLF